MHAPHAGALQGILERRSAWPLTEPAPTPQALAAIVQAAASAPDHAALRPYHFKIVQGQNRQQLLQQVLAHPLAQSGEALALHGKYRLKLTTAPAILVLAARITTHPKAPEFEQLLAAGAAVMNMLNAAHLLGYSGFWSSAPDPLGTLLHQVMGFAAQDRIIGLLNLGTPVQTSRSPAPRTDWRQYAQEWEPASPA